MPLAVDRFYNLFSKGVDLASLAQHFLGSLPKAQQLPPAVGRFPLSASFQRIQMKTPSHLR